MNNATQTLKDNLADLFSPQIQWLNSTQSTNDDAKYYATQGSQYAVCIANTQTAGRGQSGRTWQSPEGQLYLSVLLPLTQPLQGSLALEIGLALLDIPLFQARSLQTQPDLKLKWSNDLYFQDQKWGGILIEPYKKTHLIVGVGMNRLPMTLSADARKITHLGAFLEQIPPLPILLEQCIRAIYQCIQRFNCPEQRHETALSTRFHPRDALFNRQILIEVTDEQQQPITLHATAIGIQNDGALLISTTTKNRKIYAGHITLL